MSRHLNTMARLALRLALFLMVISMAARNANSQTPHSPTTLHDLRDGYRPLLVFASSPDDPALLAQLHRLKDAAPGLMERQVLVIAVPFNNPSETDVSLTPADSTAARRKFHIAPAEFAVVLVGKDGGEKLRSGKPVSFDKLRETIDGMPMRQDEMKSR
jgi:hypothetical protein